MVESCRITEWSIIRMPLEYRTKFCLLFRPPFEYRTSEYWASESSLFRCFRYSDVRYSDVHSIRFRSEEDEKSEDEDRLSRHRRIHQPEVLSDGEKESDDDDRSKDDDMER